MAQILEARRPSRHRRSIPPETHSVLDADAFRSVSAAILAGVAVAAAYFAASGRWYDAAAVAGLVVLGAGFMLWRDRLPSLFTLLFVIAGAVNAAGYVFNLWKEPLWFDELVHAYTSFTVSAAIGWVLLARTSLYLDGRGGAFALSVAGLGIVLGLLWELFEWAIGIIGTPADTIVDIVMDSAGAIAAGLFCAWAAASPEAARPGLAVPDAPGRQRS